MKHLTFIHQTGKTSYMRALLIFKSWNSIAVLLAWASIGDFWFYCTIIEFVSSYGIWSWRIWQRNSETSLKREASWASIEWISRLSNGAAVLGGSQFYKTTVTASLLWSHIVQWSRNHIEFPVITAQLFRCVMVILFVSVWSKQPILTPARYKMLDSVDQWSDPEWQLSVYMALCCKNLCLSGWYRSFHCSYYCH